MQAGMDQYLVSASMLFSSHAGIENTASSQIAYVIFRLKLITLQTFGKSQTTVLNKVVPVYPPPPPPPTNFVGRGIIKHNFVGMTYKLVEVSQIYTPLDI